MTDAADVDGDQQREYQRLYDADEDFKKVKRYREQIFRPRRQCHDVVDEIFAAEDIAVQTEGQRDQSE